MTEIIITHDPPSTVTEVPREIDTAYVPTERVPAGGQIVVVASGLVGPLGPEGETGPVGPTGATGPAGTAVSEVYVQATTPTVPVGQPYIWWQTGLGAGGADFTLYFGVGPATP